MENEKIVLNVGGKRFTTVVSTLSNIPGTRLATLSKSDYEYDPVSQEYFFDRNPQLFGPILDYYRTGQLHFAHCICGPSIEKELDFWQIDENCIAPCCWTAYKSAAEENKTLKKLAKTLTVNQQSKTCCPVEDDPDVSWLTRGRSCLWSILEKPYSSIASKVWASLIFVFIITSITVVAMETHPIFRIPKTNEVHSEQNFTSSKEAMFHKTDLHPALWYLDFVATVVFVLELIVRFICSPSKRQFFKSAFNIIDILCVLPMLIVMIIQLVLPEIWTGQQFYSMLSYTSLASVLRVFRLFKLARHYRGLKILQLAVGSSLRELFLLFLLISIGTLVFSTLIYYAEFSKDNEYTSIPIGFWWSIITMTTVGYGDFKPTSSWGYLVGGMCAISGTLITGLPIPIIASNFNHYYKNSLILLSMSERRPPKTCRWKGRRQNSIYRHSGLDPQGSSLSLNGRQTDDTLDRPPSVTSDISVFSNSQNTLMTPLSASPQILSSRSVQATIILHETSTPRIVVESPSDFQEESAGLANVSVNEEPYQRLRPSTSSNRLQPRPRQSALIRSASPLTIPHNCDRHLSIPTS